MLRRIIRITMVAAAVAALMFVDQTRAEAVVSHKTLQAKAALGFAMPGDGVVEIPFGADDIGIHWTGGIPTSETSDNGAIRLRAADGTWGSWIALLQDGAQPEGGFASALVPAGKAVAYQVRLPPGATAPQGVAINTSDGPKVVLSYKAKKAAGAAPSVVTRAEWGADESMRNESVEGYAPSSPQKLTVHHTVSYGHGPSEVRAIYAYHAGIYGDIAYHFLIDSDGTVYEGRYSGTDGVPAFDSEGLVTRASHVEASNGGNIGTAMIGDFTSSVPTTEARNALIELEAYLATRTGIDPTGHSIYLNGGVNSGKDKLNLLGHRDWKQTACPGDAFYPDLPNIRTAVKAKTTPLPPFGTGRFVSTAPTRLLDTRSNNTPLGESAERVLKVAGGASPAPADAVAVVLNVTVADPTASSFLTVWPSGRVRNFTSNLNYVAGETAPNLVTVPVGLSGNVSFINFTGQATLVVDLVGWYDPNAGTGYNALTPARLLDTRSSAPGAFTADQSRSLLVRGRGGVPLNASAVTVNLTATNATDPTFVTAYPSDTTQPLASNLNVVPGETRANLATIGVGNDGAIKLYNWMGTTDLVADVVGWYGSTGGTFHPLTPTRVYDTRPSSALDGGTNRPVALAGQGGVPSSGATAVVVNATMAAPVANEYLTVWPTGATRPVASNINAAAGQVIPNQVVTGLGPDGSASIYTNIGRTDVVFDAVGYFA